MRSALLLFLAISSFYNQGFSQTCEFMEGNEITIDFSNFAITSITDNGQDCNFDYTLDYKVNNPLGCGVNFQSSVQTDAGSLTAFTIETDGALHTTTGTIFNTNCTGNTFIKISGGWGFPCTGVTIAWPGATCTNLPYSILNLPVELVNFKTERRGNQVNLYWSTATELNNKQFNIEHSSDGKDYVEIGNVEGNGTSTISNEYRFSHLNPEVGNNYYRLKQVNEDGTFEYSEVVDLVFKNIDRTVEVFPNPTSDNVYFAMTSELIGTFEIYNQTGQLIQKARDINAEPFTSLEQFSTGWYFLIFRTNLGESAQRVFKY